MIGSLGIAHCWLGDSEAAKLEKYAGRRRVLPEFFMPPAPLRVDVLTTQNCGAMSAENGRETSGARSAGGAAEAESS